MKDRNMSNKYDRQNYKRNDDRSRSSNHDSESYKHVLKERYHYRDDEKNKKREDDKNKKDKDHDRDLNHTSSHSHKRHKSESPDHRSHHKSSTKFKSDFDRNPKNHKRQDNVGNESYEELSRRKRKLESELRALDIEEAAEKEAENKKICRNRPHKSAPKVPEIKVKEEPPSDDERFLKKLPNDKRSSKNASKNQRSEKVELKVEKPDRKHSRDQTHRTIQTEKEKYKKSASKSSDEEKGWGKSEPKSKPPEKEKPNFETSGNLAEETNTYNGIVIKYNEPAEARKPKRRWRLYPFKGDSELPFIPIHRQSAYLFGRTRLIADIPIDHPSCSKQHAVLQFRLISFKREDGTTGRRVRPYIIDLESSNGTFINNSRIEPRCYVELCEQDVIKFGYSSREYVILHEESKFSKDDDDVPDGNT